MAFISDFTSDNLGNPDQYVLKTNCSKVRIREKDLTVATLAIFNVYIPIVGASYVTCYGGEELSLGFGTVKDMGSSPFSMATVNVASSVFTIIEE